MNVEIVDQIPSVIEGALAKYVGLREDGLFGLVEPPSPLMTRPPPPQIKRGQTLEALVSTCRAIVAGDARSITTPGVTTDLAVGVLATVAHLGRLSFQLQSAMAELEGRRSQPEDAP